MAHLVLIEDDNGDVVDQEVYCSDFCAKQSEHYAGWNGCNEIGYNEPCAECGVELAGVNEMEKTTYTIWFSDSPGHQDGYLENISEEKMIELSDRYGFDAEEVINYGETYMWPEGIEPYDNPRPTSDDVVGGCYRVNK